MLLTYLYAKHYPWLPHPLILDKYTGSMVCSKQLYKEALNHAFDEPNQNSPDYREKASAMTGQLPDVMFSPLSKADSTETTSR